MTHFSPEPLSPEEMTYLGTCQTRVNEQPTRQAQYMCALETWKDRKNKKKEEQIWQSIEQKLEANHPTPGLCQYCEFDRNAATEHFFPKKHFPERTFQWDNYLRVCSNCNSKHKSDNFAVFSPKGSAMVFHLLNTKSTYPMPPSDDAVLINPRTENPQNYLRLDIGTGVFIRPDDIDLRGAEKAKYTVELLHLNMDNNLLRYRQKALDQYQNKLEFYVKVKQAIDFQSLIGALPPAKRAIVVQTNPFSVEKERLLKVLKADIQDDLFPCAWREIIAQKDFFPTLQSLFSIAPEAETW